MQINETNAYTEYTTTEPTTDFVVGFEYFNNKAIDTINITVNGVDVNTVGYVVTKVNNSVFRLTPAVPSGSTVRLMRETDLDAPVHKFSEGALFRAPNVDTNFKQILHAQQEVRDYSVDTRNTVTTTLTNYDGRIDSVETTTAQTAGGLKAEIQARIRGDLDGRRYAEDLLGMGQIWDGVSSRSVWDYNFGTNQAEINLAQANKVISVQDYGAVGDSIIDDTGAFQRLEAKYTGRTVDLLGRTYLVSSLPKGNTYTNGTFKVGGVLVNAQGSFKVHSDTSAGVFNLDTAGQLYSVRAQMVRYTAGALSVVQSIAVDEVNRYMYSLTASTPNKLICRYDLDSPVYNQSIDQNNDNNNVLGHQGLAVEQLGGKDTLLWTSSDIAPNTGSKVHTVKYKPLADGAITLEESWTLFPLDGVSQSLTPTISADQRYLLVMRQFNDVDGSGVLVRMFDMQTIKAARKAGRFDIQNEYLIEFRHKDVGSPAAVSRQDIVCDGHYIYVLWGTWYTTTEDYILKFDMRGNLVQRYDCHHIGLQNSIEGGTEGQHEPEGLCFVTSPKGGYTLLYQVAFGDGGGRKCWVYELGGEQPVQSYTDSAPALLLNSRNGLELCAPTGNPIRFGNYSNSRGYTKHLTLDSTGRLLKGIDSSLAIGGTTNGLQYHATSTQANAVFARWSSGAAQYAQVMLFKSAGTSVGTSVPTPADSTLGAVSFFGDVGTGTTTNVGVECASVKAVTTANTTGEVLPTKLVFSTRSAVTYTVRWEIGDVGTLTPFASNTYAIGTSASVVKDIYVQNAPIVTSDERYKSAIRELNTSELDCALACAKLYRVYKLNAAINEKGVELARYHIGTIAQLIIEAFTAHGLDWRQYGVVTYEEWDDKYTMSDEGTPILHIAGGSKYSVRYEELNSFISAGLAYKLESLLNT